MVQYYNVGYSTVKICSAFKVLYPYTFQMITVTMRIQKQNHRIGITLRKF